MGWVGLYTVTDPVNEFLYINRIEQNKFYWQQLDQYKYKCQI